MTQYVLTVCVGILWGGMCDLHRQIVYPSQAACEFEAKKLSARIRDGYVRCDPAPLNKEKQDDRK